MLAAVPIASLIFLCRALGEGTLETGMALSFLLVLVLALILEVWVSDKGLSLRFNANYRMFADYRLKIAERIMNVPLGSLGNERLGEISAALTTTLADVEYLAFFLAEKMLGALLGTVVMTGILLWVEPLTGLVALLGFILSQIISFKLDALSVTLSSARQKAQASLTGKALEYFRGLAVVKAYGLGPEAFGKFTQAIGDSRARNIALERGVGFYGALYRIVFKLSAIAILALATARYLSGAISVADALFLLTASFFVYAQTQFLGSLGAFLRLMDESLSMILPIAKAPIQESGKLKYIENYNVDFKDVTYSYGQKGDAGPAVKDLSFSISQGKKCALVGSSGSGKTTTAHLLARFFDPDLGQVTLGGVNIKDFSLDFLMENLTIVFQELWLFEGSIYENILFAKPQASYEEVTSAAKKAMAHGFISQLPNGYETVVGEDGARLSRGERQRISIARAILKDAPTVILDEATSSLDPINAKEVRYGFSQLSKGKTVLVIAHDLDSVKDADSIVVLNEGSVAERGTHEELMKKDGLYRSFVEKRWGLFSKDGN